MEKYYALNTMDVKAIMNGGRLFDAKNENVAHNGVFGVVKGLIAGELHLRHFTIATAETIKNELPMVVAQPELAYDESRRSNNMTGNFRIHEGQAFNVVPLAIGDTIEVSADLINGSNLVVGNFIAQANGGGLSKVSAAPTSDVAKAYFKIVASRDSHVMQTPFGDGKVTTPATKMFALELIAADAPKAPAPVDPAPTK